MVSALHRQTEDGPQSGNRSSRVWQTSDRTFIPSRLHRVHTLFGKRVTEPWHPFTHANAEEVEERQRDGHQQHTDGICRVSNIEITKMIKMAIRQFLMNISSEMMPSRLINNITSGS